MATKGTNGLLSLQTRRSPCNFRWLVCKEKRNDVIQAKDDPDYGINVGIKVWTSDDMWTDFDWLNFPYYENGDVLDMGLTIAYRDDIDDGLHESTDYEPLTDALLRWYDEVKDLELNNDGMILKEAK